MFREIREIKEEEKNLYSSNGYQRIGFDPDKRISKEEIAKCNEFWKNEFEQGSKIFDPDRRI